MKELLIIFNQNNFQDNHLKKTVNVFDSVRKPDRDIFIFYDNYIPVKDLISGGIKNYQMMGTDNGERMMNCFIKGFIKKYSHIILVNNLINRLDEELINGAFQKLNQYDVILGPPISDRIYLIGMKKLASFIFEEPECLFSSALTHLNRSDSNYYILSDREVSVLKDK